MRLVLTALTVAALVAVTAAPAAAQNTNYQATFKLQYWGAPFEFTNFFAGPTPFSDSASTWGLSLRMDDRTRPWSFSARYDTMSVARVNTVWNQAQLWDVNVHYRFGTNLDQYVGVFLGYGGVSVNDPGGVNTGSTSGFRLGADFMLRQPSGWYITGEGAYGPSWSSTFAAFPGMANGNVLDLRVATGYEFTGGWGLEVGWRYIDWDIPASTGCPTAPGCQFQFSGVTAALTFRR